MILSDLRKAYHKKIFQEILYLKHGVPNFADKDSKSSSEIACEMIKSIGLKPRGKPVSEQSVGKVFGELTCDYLNKSFSKLAAFRPGEWNYSTSQDAEGITKFAQYRHLAILDQELQKNRDLKSILGGTYLVRPDIIIARAPVSDKEINRKEDLLGEKEEISRLTPFRARNSTALILHACVSCKWTIRSDRSQNTRTEALNLIRFRKGNAPHIVAVIAEPLPTRIASIALGTGDIDCVYHVMLPELKAAAENLKKEDQLDMLTTLISGERLRDISDLPFELAV